MTPAFPWLQRVSRAPKRPIAPNLLQRNFTVNAPNAVWVTDVTCVWTDGGWLFLAVMLDLFARRVVGWSSSDRNDTERALTALDGALRSRKPRPGLIHHSDRGSPYASAEYRQALQAHGIVASMSRKGDCWDNAVAESFFAILKTELTDAHRYATREAATSRLAEYITSFYDWRRRHSHLGYVSPIEFELTAGIARQAA